MCRILSCNKHQTSIVGFHLNSPGCILKWNQIIFIVHVSVHGPSTEQQRSCSMFYFGLRSINNGESSPNTSKWSHMDLLQLADLSRGYTPKWSGLVGEFPLISGLPHLGWRKKKATLWKFGQTKPCEFEKIGWNWWCDWYPFLAAKRWNQDVWMLAFRSPGVSTHASGRNLCRSGMW